MAASTFHLRDGSLDDLRRMAVDGRLYVILDACDEPAVPQKVMELGPERAMSLFRGSAEYEQWNVAPYLVKVDGALLDWITKNLWQKPWGIFVVAEEQLKTLRKHFRHFLMVEDPDGEAMYFRYYDPRILEAFLAACNEEEFAIFCGPVKGYAVGTPEGRVIKFFLRLRMDDVA